MTEHESAVSRLREWINQGAGKVLALVVALGLVAGAVAWMLRDEKSQQMDSITARGRRVLYVCKNPSCKSRGTMRAAYDAEWPERCPECKQRQAVIGFKCLSLKCDHILERTTAAVIRCPKCGHVHDNSGPREDPSPPPLRR